MAALPHNIDKSQRRGEYIGYCNGAQRIRKECGYWVTYGLGSAQGKQVYASGKTLRELGDKLDRVKNG